MKINYDDDHMYEDIEDIARASFRRWKSNTCGQIAVRGDEYNTHLIWATIQWMQKNRMKEIE